MRKSILKALSFKILVAATLFVGISCDKKEDFEPKLELDINEVTLASSESSNATINITSNATWNVTSSQSWLSISPAEGSNNGVVTLTAQQNADTTIRTATVTVTVQDLSPLTVEVSQNGSLYELSLSESAFNFESEASNAEFTVTSNTSWTVNSSESWLSLTTTNGTNNGSVNFTVEKNSETTERTAVITVAGDKTANQTILVTQKGIVYSLAFSTKSVVAEPAGGETTFDIITNTDWTISYEETWLTINPTSGSGNATVSVTIASNPAGSERISRLNVDAGNLNRQVVRVTQNGIPCGPNDEIPCELSVCNVVVPSYSSLPSNPYLPDPFMFLNGSRMTSKAEWACRRAEIAVLSQEYQYGYKPCTPYEATTAVYNDNAITVTVTGNGKTISFNCPISYPTVGEAPYPAVISLGFSMVNQLMLEMGVAVITLPNDAIAEQSNTGSRGKGLFYDYFCKDHSAGAIMAWAWGASRLIDALEKTPEANINPERLAVTGCSRNGKGALAVGAFDERIALTIPFESGSGGSASWRVSDFQGSSVQRLQQIVGENAWFRANFNQFSQTANKLPYDQHSILGMCAPRGLLVIENPWQTWLGNLSTWTSGNAAYKIYEALGVPDNMGFSHIGNSGHCFYTFSDVLTTTLDKFVQKFLFDNESVEAHIMYLEGSELVYDEEKWVNWTVPELD